MCYGSHSLGEIHWEARLRKGQMKRTPHSLCGAGTFDEQQGLVSAMAQAKEKLKNRPRVWKGVDLASAPRDSGNKIEKNFYVFTFSALAINWQY